MQILAPCLAHHKCSVNTLGLNKGQFCPLGNLIMSGDVFHVQLRGPIGIQGGEDQECCSTFYNTLDSSTQRIIWPKISIMPKVENDELIVKTSQRPLVGKGQHTMSLTSPTLVIFERLSVPPRPQEECPGQIFSFSISLSRAQGSTSLTQNTSICGSY